VNDKHGQILPHAAVPARAPYTTKSGLTYQITKLEKAGLVRRSAWPGDMRGVVAALTGAGRQRLARAAPGQVAAVRAC
jgi:DNA-binding MarR family transcriptional regulator